MILYLLDFRLHMIVRMLDFPVHMIVYMIVFPLHMIVHMLDFPVHMIVHMLDLPVHMIKFYHVTYHVNLPNHPIIQRGVYLRKEGVGVNYFSLNKGEAKGGVELIWYKWGDPKVILGYGVKI